MKICIAGWYFRPAFFRSVYQSGFEAFVLKHREGDTCGLPSKQYPNLGLEFGAYRQYVENHWDGESDVLFCHDDTEVATPDCFSDIARLNSIGVDQAYIFNNYSEQIVNGGVHGRALWMRGATLLKIADNFPADMDNQGTNVGKIAQRGVLRFHARMRDLTSNTMIQVIMPQMIFGHRGHIPNEMFVYRDQNLVSASKTLVTS